MMTPDIVVRARIDLDTKTRATAALAAMGLSVSDYIRMALTRVAHDEAVPFDVKVPNVLTAQTLIKSNAGEDVHRAADAEALFKQLDI
jgi:DNA-damage-inducible protein J